VKRMQDEKSKKWGEWAKTTLV